MLYFVTPWTIAHQALLSMDFPGNNTRVGCHFLLQGIFPTQESNLHLLLARQILYHWATWEAKDLVTKQQQQYDKVIQLFVYIFLEKAMAPHFSILAWKIPWTEEPGRLQTMGLWRVGHDWATSLSLFPFMHWRRKWQPTPVFLPGESQGRGSLVGCHLWGHTESDMTEVT